MYTKKLKGTSPELYTLVAPLVMNPVVLRQNNNYPFKTGPGFQWYLAIDGADVAGFIPVKPNKEGWLIDNYYVRGDKADVLSRLLQFVIDDLSATAPLLAMAHVRHSELFSQHGFMVCVELKRYHKMQYNLTAKS